jgi:hypothetical protein
MKIYKQYKEPNALKIDVGPEDAIKYMEESGAYKPGTVNQILTGKVKAKICQTLFAIYYFEQEI